MRLVLTGSTGFIGNHLAAGLIQSGHEVHALVRNPQRLDLQGLAGRHTYDGTLDSVDRALDSTKPDAVMHLASLFVAEHTSGQVDDLVKSNILFGTHLLEAMANQGVGCLLNTGTAWQHFNNQDYDPVCLYAATKEAFEKIIDYYVSAKGVRCITLQLYDTFGPRDPRRKLFNLLLDTGKSKSSLDMSAGEQEINLLYIDDVVQAFKQALDLLTGSAELQHAVYAVGASTVYSLREVVAIFEEVSGYKLNINWGARPYRKREVMQVWKRGRILPGWKQRIDLKTGIASLLNHWKESE